MGKSRTFCWAGIGERRKDRWVTHDSPIFFFLFINSSHIWSCEGHWFKLHRINELKFAVGTGESYSSNSNCSPVKKCLSPSEKDFSVEKPREIFPMKVIVQLRLVWFVNYWLCEWQVGLAHRQTRARPRGWFWNQTGPFDFYQTETKKVLSSMNTDQREAIAGQVLTAHKLFIKPRCTSLKNVARLFKKGCFAGENSRV